MATKDDKAAGSGPSQKPQQETMLDDEFSLELQEASPGRAMPRKESSGKRTPDQRKEKNQSSEVLSYRHDDKRTNNPHVGMVDTHSDGVEGKTAWQYDPHIDPALNFDSSRSTIETLIDDALASGDKEQMQAALEQLKRMQSPYLNWSGKAERTSFSVDTVSLHVHERIDPATILAAVQKKLKDGKGKPGTAIQPDLFHAPFENLPLREAIDFYKHDRDWANRLIAGDSLLVMNSLLQKEGMAGQVQMIYLDPPYGIKYGSNFQPFVNKRDVKDRSDDDLTQEPEMIKAFRDTWELGIHSYLTYLRDRLLLAKELLHESGSVFVQISDENVHLVRNLLSEVFGEQNFYAQIAYFTTPGLASKGINKSIDYLLWYAKNKEKMKYKPVYLPKEAGTGVGGNYNRIEYENGSRRPLTSAEREKQFNITNGARLFLRDNATSGAFRENTTIDYDFQGNIYNPGGNRCWKTTKEGLDRLTRVRRLEATGSARLCSN
ncbi:MAG: DNA methyltransferase [Nitrosomonas sp.]|uniref:DNA methyltransferase n=1 Tax=Nitrosomonas sp. TaxID=42353 RepID=UPI00273333F6|nr:DNA methyltransferase [Nitrosomonas sp.]MDP3280882.1 DNA methyltransferase [Nitrosomonas sp.]MDP3662349.1 DNA methyltransferase [Nitrosomonas sp.]MDZ4107535.1 DNA methyltransferase [Nitrosomonas sp.]